LSFLVFLEFVFFHQNACQIIKNVAIAILTDDLHFITSSKRAFFLSLRRGKSNKKDIVLYYCAARTIIQVFNIPVFKTIVPACTFLLSIYA